MREIAYDSETTGLTTDDRIIELAAVELINQVPSGQEFSVRVNPCKRIHPEATRVHGITDDMVLHLPVFRTAVKDFKKFIGSSPLIIHNARFDIPMLQREMSRLRLKMPENEVVDTMELAKRKHPGSNYSLGSLCKKFRIPITDAHSALGDARMLAGVYLGLLGGRQRSLVMEDLRRAEYQAPARIFRAPRPHAASESELAAHAAFLSNVKEPIWLR